MGELRTKHVPRKVPDVCLEYFPAELRVVRRCGVTNPILETGTLGAIWDYESSSK